MNEYEFEYEVNEDGWFSTYRTFAANKLSAYEDLIVHLRECNIDPTTVEVLNCWVSECDGEENEDDTE